MTTDKLDAYKNKLKKEQGLIEEEIRQNSRPPDFGHDLGGTSDTEEETDQTDALSNQLAVAQDLKKRLVDVEVALQKIQNGKYGACEKCGREIGEPVLDIDPESRFCKNCKLSM